MYYVIHVIVHRNLKRRNKILVNDPGSMGGGVRGGDGRKQGESWTLDLQLHIYRRGSPHTVRTPPPHSTPRKMHRKRKGVEKKPTSLFKGENLKRKSGRELNFMSYLFFSL
jgi:hypothetical protein